MRGLAQKIGAGLAAAALGLAGARPSLAQNTDQAQTAAAPQGGVLFKVNSELILTNVVARDAKTGELVRGLKQSDFAIYENGKRQQISTFDFESVEMAAPLNEATISGLAAGATGNGTAVVARPEDLRNHRLIVMFFDLTSMQPEDLDRSVAAAQEFLRDKMQPADLVALVGRVAGRVFHLICVGSCSLSEALAFSPVVDRDLMNERSLVGGKVLVHCQCIA